MTVTIEDIHRHEGAHKNRRSYGRMPSTEIPPLFDEVVVAPEAATTSPLAKPLAEQALKVPEQTPELELWPVEVEQGGESEPLVGNRADHWFAEQFGERWWHALGFAERSDATAPRLTEAFLSRKGVVGRTSPERVAAIVSAWLSGESLTLLAERHPEYGDKAATGMLLTGLRRRFAQSMQAEIDQKRPVSARWAEQLGFNEQDTKSFRVYLNVTGGTIMGRDESRVAGKFKQHLVDGFGTIDHEEIGLSEVQRRIMRDILGAMPTDEGVTPEQRRIQPVGRFLHHYNRREYEFRDPKAMIVELRTALEALLAADRKRPATPVRQVTAPDTDAPVIY